jgi:hypothetical protein
MSAFGITSMSHELGREVSLDEARDALLLSLGQIFNVEFHTAQTRQIA